MTSYALFVTLTLASPQTPTAKQVLALCQKAYDSVKTLEVTVNSVSGKSKSSARISFQRPGKLRVSGQSLFESPYDLLVDGKNAWVRMNGDGWEKQENIENGLASITGIGGTAGTHTPAMLLHTQWGSVFGHSPSDLTLKTATVGGKKLYVLQSLKPTDQTFWIDAKTHFLVKFLMNAMGQTITVTFNEPKVNVPIAPARFKR